ncbi:MAG: HNH endonuclease [Spirochaetaceae bacterium]|jgi:hypothetical protein|nr:HNH endonuclease [Spirochaetaceae bacterium]
MTGDEFWIKEFGNTEYAKDFAGRKIKRSEQGKNTEQGWTVDHILPGSKNGINDLGNLQITSFKTNQEKADKTTFVINGIQVFRNTLKNTKGKRLANHDYTNKKYCITIIGGTNEK